MGMYLPSLDAAASALGMESKTGNESDYHTYGNVKSINADGSYQVQLNTSSVTTKCVRGCNASVGDRVIVVIRRDGQAIALARVGGNSEAISSHYSVDLNSFTETGKYYIETGTNLPIAGNPGWLDVMRCEHAKSYLRQEFTTYPGVKAYRNCIAGSWTAWTYASKMDGNNNFWGLLTPDGGQGWIRSTQQGFLPQAPGVGNLGSWDYQFAEVRSRAVYRDNRLCFAGAVLYNNITGTNGTVYLSESVANFSWLRIFYRDNDWFKASIDVHSPQGTYGDLVITAKSPSGIFWTKHRTVSISGSAISSIRYGCYSVYGTAVGGNGDENTNNIWITAVVGYYT